MMTYLCHYSALNTRNYRLNNDKCMLPCHTKSIKRNDIAELLYYNKSIMC